jgi:hypothetical protein
MWDTLSYRDKALIVMYDDLFRSLINHSGWTNKAVCNEGDAISVALAHYGIAHIDEIKDEQAEELLGLFKAFHRRKNTRVGGKLIDTVTGQEISE